MPRPNEAALARIREFLTNKLPKNWEIYHGSNARIPENLMPYVPPETLSDPQALADIRGAMFADPTLSFYHAKTPEDATRYAETTSGALRLLRELGVARDVGPKSKFFLTRDVGWAYPPRQIPGLEDWLKPGYSDEQLTRMLNGLPSGIITYRNTAPVQPWGPLPTEELFRQLIKERSSGRSAMMLDPMGRELVTWPDKGGRDYFRRGYARGGWV